MAAISSSDGKQWIGGIIKRLKKQINIETVLDIGVGEGTYSDLFRQQIGGRWTGVEAYTPYIDEFKLREKYDEIINDDARNHGALPAANISFAGDVLEHLEKADCLALYEHLLDTSDFVIFSVPIVHFPQGAEGDNHWQEHKADWRHDDVLANFGSIKTWYRGKICGVYVASKRHALDIPTHTFPKIAIYGIAKNERAFVDRMVTSALPADVILITDTGSDDGTYERLKELEADNPGKVIAHRITVNPWRFDMARNAALALLPDDIDLCISVDLDEVLADGWRQPIEDNFRHWHTRMFYWFAWSKHADGSDNVAFWGDKAHARHNYRWVHPIHEVIEPYGIDEQIVYVNARLDHYPDNSKPRSQYLALLELSCKEAPTYGKNSLYLGREYYFYGLHDKAIIELERYLSLPEASWAPDRSSAMRYIAKSYQAKGGENNLLNAGAMFEFAANTSPEMRENWGDFVQFAYDTANWQSCYTAAKTMLTITQRTQHYLYDPKFYGAYAHDMLAIAAWNLGLKDEAIAAGRVALTHSPDDHRLKNNLAIMEANKAANV